MGEALRIGKVALLLKGPPMMRGFHWLT